MARAAGEMLALLISTEECGVASVHYVGSYVPFVRPLRPLAPKPKRSSNESEARGVNTLNDSANSTGDAAKISLTVSALAEKLDDSTISRNLLLRLIKFSLRNQVLVHYLNYVWHCDLLSVCQGGLSGTMP